ncbi:MAG: hypothetical protein ACLFU8_06220 [Anaerolineales bacterium]
MAGMLISLTSSPVPAAGGEAYGLVVTGVVILAGIVWGLRHRSR